MMDWTDHLPELPTTGLAEVFPQAARTNAKLAKGKTTRRQVDRRRFVRMMEVQHAAEAIGKLPTKRESIHCVMSGSFDGFAIVHAIHQLAKCNIKRLDIATLGFNRRNADELFAMLDDGRIGTVQFVCSNYFRSVDVELFTHLHQGLANRGHQCAVVRSHAKLLLFEMLDGRHYVWESSANLRSCRNAETFVLSQSADLLRFHRQWMDELVSKTPQENTK
jgi:hypothetical protein